MPKQQQPQGPSATQLKGEDGVCETVVVDGVRVNKHDLDDDEQSSGKPDKHSPVNTPISTRKATAKKSGGNASDEDFDGMTVEELKKHLDKEGVEYTSDDLKDDLVKKAKKGK